MAAAGRTALLGAIIWISAPALSFAQFWPWSQPKPPAPAVQAEPVQPPQNITPLPPPAPQTKSNAVPPPPKANTPAPAASQQPAAAVTPTAAKTMKPGETLALDDNQRSLIDRVSLYLSTIQTLVGDFVQVGPDGSKSDGQFYIQKPGRVRFEYSPPNPIDITADGRLVSVRNRDLDTQDLFPLSQTPLRFILSDRIDLRRETNIVGVYADDIFVTIVIEEKHPLVGTNRLMMMFDSRNLQLKQWTVTDAQGFDTTVAVSNLDQSTRPDPAIFTINTSRNN